MAVKKKIFIFHRKYKSFQLVSHKILIEILQREEKERE